MKPIRCIVIDDNQPSIDLLENYISKIRYLELIKGFTNPIDAINEIDDLHADLIFLDMQMPEMSGIDFLKSKKPKQLVIVISDYKEYAIDTYEINTYSNIRVIDYLSKIIKFDRFLAACEKAKSCFLEKKTNNIISNIFLKDGTTKHKVFIDDIIYIDSEQQYKNVVLVENEENKKVRTRPLKEAKEYYIQVRNSTEDVLAILPKDIFVQINRSTIISINHLKKILSVDEIEMSNGTTHTIALTYKDNFVEQIKHLNTLGSTTKQ